MQLRAIHLIHEPHRMFVQAMNAMGVRRSAELEVEKYSLEIALDFVRGSHRHELFTN